MAIATDAMVQAYSDARVRSHSLLIVTLVEALRDDKANIDDVYSALTQDTPTWTDTRSTANGAGMAHLLTVSDMLAWNAFITDLLNMIQGHASWPIVQKSLINPLV